MLRQTGHHEKFRQVVYKRIELQSSHPAHLFLPRLLEENVTCRNGPIREEAMAVQEYPRRIMHIVGRPEYRPARLIADSIR